MTLRHVFATSVVGLALAVGSGCASQSDHHEYSTELPGSVPHDAAISSTGTANLRFTPVTDGRVYIYDRTADKLLYEGEINRGNMVEVDAPHNRILIGGRVVSDRDLKPGHDKEIYFRPSESTKVVERTVRFETVASPGSLALPPELPSEAVLMNTGNARLRFKPTTDGRVFIYDRTAGKLLYQGRVDRGEVVEVDSRDNRIVVGGNTVSQRDLKPGHEKEIYFKTEPTTVQERTVREKVVEKEVTR